jgi:hypothetical protein
MKLIAFEWKLPSKNVFVFVTSPRLEREGTRELRKRICSRRYDFVEGKRYLSEKINSLKNKNNSNYRYIIIIKM